MTAMAKIYRKKILAHAFNFQDLDEKYIEDVKILLREDVAAGRISPYDYESITGEPYEEEVNE